MTNCTIPHSTLQNIKGPIQTNVHNINKIITELNTIHNRVKNIEKKTEKEGVPAEDVAAVEGAAEDVASVEGAAEDVASVEGGRKRKSRKSRKSRKKRKSRRKKKSRRKRKSRRRRR